MIRKENVYLHTRVLGIPKKHMREREREGERERVPSISEESLATSGLGRERASSIFNTGESCPAAKPSLATFENNFLSPIVGELDDTTAGLPNT